MSPTDHNEAIFPCHECVILRIDANSKHHLLSFIVSVSCVRIFVMTSSSLILFFQLRLKYPGRYSQAKQCWANIDSLYGHRPLVLLSVLIGRTNVKSAMQFPLRLYASLSSLHVSRPLTSSSMAPSIQERKLVTQREASRRPLPG